jgi:hypothetical protein
LAIFVTGHLVHDFLGQGERLEVDRLDRFGLPKLGGLSDVSTYRTNLGV